MIYLITHGERNYGINPEHINKGIEQLRKLQIPSDIGSISLVIIGTGARFREIYETIKSQIPNIPVKYSPFCGSVDGLEANYDIILIDGTTVNQDDYLGLVETSGFNAWDFVAGLPHNTLLCAGGELMIALGLKAINEKGQLYELDPPTKGGWKIS